MKPMDSLPLLSTLRQAGLSVRVREGQLLIGPRALLTPELRERIASGREELLADLAEEEYVERVVSEVCWAGHERQCWRGYGEWWADHGGRPVNEEEDER